MNNKRDIKWILLITIIAFIISIFFSLISELIIPNASIFMSIILIIIFIVLGIVFDIVGVAIQSCDESVFHSMSTKKVYGAKTAVKLIKKREKVSSFCNDVIGDICGVISGSCGITLSIKLAKILHINSLYTTIIITSVISAIIIGGKAMGKKTAINNSNSIIHKFSGIINIFVK